MLQIAGSASRFEELDGIPVRILDLDLSATGTAFHFVAKTKSRLLQFVDEAPKIRDPQHHSIPATWLLLLSVRHRPRARCAGAAEQNLGVTEGYVGKGRKLLVLQFESKMLRVKRDRAR